ncbi:hypothetical protein JMM59_20975 [Rhodovulum sulfidophilum]|nr:hypothetical protein [Rhodovulum sulfidophilum]
MANDERLSALEKTLNSALAPFRFALRAIRKLFSVGGLASIFLILNIIYFASEFVENWTRRVIESNRISGSISAMQGLVLDMDRTLQKVVAQYDHQDLPLFVANHERNRHFCMTAANGAFNQNGISPHAISVGSISGLSRDDTFNARHIVKVICESNFFAVSGSGFDEDFLRDVVASVASRMAENLGAKKLISGAGEEKISNSNSSNATSPEPPSIESQIMLPEE